MASSLRAVHWILSDASHRIENDNGDLGARLLESQRDARHSGANCRPDVARSKMIHCVPKHVIFALRTGTKTRFCLAIAYLVIDLADNFLDRVDHPAMGNEIRSVTTAPVKVDPVVPVSATVT